MIAVDRNVLICARDQVIHDIRRSPPRPHHQRTASASSTQYAAFVDMSGGSNDDAVLGIAHRDADGCAVLDCLTGPASAL